MTSYLVEGTYDSLDLHHIRMNFSSHMKEVGKMKLMKIPMMAYLICQIWYWRFRGYKNLFYPPASGNLVPIIRDVIVLGCTRFLFDKTIFHFHTADLTSAYEKLPSWLKPLYRNAYFKPDLSILVAENSGIDAEVIHSIKTVVVPNAVPDFGTVCRQDRNETPRILFVGAVTAEKGVMELVEAAGRLASHKCDFEVDIVGAFVSDEFENRLKDRINSLGIGDRVDLLGRISDNGKKNDIYKSADIFCFPSYYSAETFGLVVIEAMSNGLPVVSTKWRGIQEIVVEGETGNLVETHDTDLLTERLEELLGSRQKRHKLGEAGRERFLKNYTLEVYRQRMEDSIYSACV